MLKNTIDEEFSSDIFNSIPKKLIKKEKELKIVKKL